jgi:hypothetical protein
MMPGVRRRHEGPDVLHLYTSFALEDEGRPRAGVCVPRDGGRRACVVSGGAGEDFARWIYASALFNDDNATLADVREAVMTLEDTARTGRRVLGGAHPEVVGIERVLRGARAELRARETPSPGSA